MKYLSAVLAVLMALCLSLPLRAQQYVIDWVNSVDNGSDDYAYSINVDTDGNVYVTGGSSIGADFDYLTLKYDSLGNILWA